MLLTSACTYSSSGGPPNGPPGGGPTASAACADMAQARCDRLATCSAVLVQTRYGDAATCLTQETQSCEAGLEAPSTGGSPTHTEACSQAMATWACDDFVDNARPPPACQQQTGTVADADACAFAGQCQSGFCAVVPGDACGECAAAPVAGDACDALTTCGSGFTCASDTKQCVVFGAANGSCGAGAPCGAGLACVGADATTDTTGTCQPAATDAGAVCDPALKTGTGCDRNAGLVCNSQSKTCEAVTIAAAGEACGAVDHQTALCGAGTCTGSSAGVPGTCTANGAVGDACDLDAGPGCIAPARCIADDDDSTAGTCQINDASVCR